MKTILLCLALVVSYSVQSLGQVGIHQDLVVVQNDGTNGGLYKIAVKASGTNLTGANTMSAATIDVVYQTDRLSFPTDGPGGPLTLAAIAWNSGITGSAYSRSVTNPGPGSVRVLITGGNVNGNFDGTPAGFDVSGSSQTIVTLRFTITDMTKLATNTIDPSSNAFSLFVNENNDPNNSQSTDITGSNLTRTDITNEPLPITLSRFVASTGAEGYVNLNWTTVSEQHNYGFWVQRSTDKSNGFVSLEGSFQPGHGTTLAQHTYSYTDVTAAGVKYYYRLQQVDLDGLSNYSEAIFPGGTTGVETENVPKVFALHQNYPNPFNPSTEIRFTVEKAGPATLKVYNMLGQEVASLFNGMAQPGRYYIEKFSADKLASGVYLYRLESNNKSAVSRMLLLK